jgi:hypothetical protein
MCLKQHQPVLSLVALQYKYDLGPVEILSGIAKQLLAGRQKVCYKGNKPTAYNQ